MGWKISWVAIRGLTKPQALELLGAVETGDTDEANDADFSAAEIPGDT